MTKERKSLMQRQKTLVQKYNSATQVKKHKAHNRWKTLKWQRSVALKKKKDS